MIVSTATFHWILDHDRLFRRLYDALRPGGLLVAQCGGDGNIARTLAAADAVAARAPYAPHLAGMPQSWYFAGPEATEASAGAGFVEAHAGWRRPTPVRRRRRGRRVPLHRRPPAPPGAAARGPARPPSPARWRSGAPPTTPRGGWCWTTCASTWRRAAGDGGLTGRDPSRRRKGGPAPVGVLRKRTKEEFAAPAVRVHPRLRQLGDGPLSPSWGKSNIRGAGSVSGPRTAPHRASVLAALDGLPPVAVVAVPVHGGGEAIDERPLAGPAEARRRAVSMA